MSEHFEFYRYGSKSLMLRACVCVCLAMWTEIERGNDYRFAHTRELKASESDLLTEIDSERDYSILLYLEVSGVWDR